MKTIIEIMWKPIFKEKTLLFLVVFLASEKQFFSICQIFLVVKQFSSQVETYFLTSSSFRLVETDFLSSENSILLFRALLKFLYSGLATF